MEDDGLANHSQGSHMPHDSATMSVGSSRGEDAERIKELEDEVRELAERANLATQKYADYENEIRVLEAKLRQEQRKNSAPTVDTAAQRPGITRFGSFQITRKPVPAPEPASLPLPGTREKELEEQIVREQTLRIAAEKKVKEVSVEIEDLSTTLFEQANEMVASERKQNAELKERLETLEKQRQQQQDTTDAGTLRKENMKLKEKLEGFEHREADRRKRLERLEAANKRIDRIRTMLQPP